MSCLQRHFPAMLLASSSSSGQRRGKENKKRRRKEIRDQIMVDESIALPDPQTLLLDQVSPLLLDFRYKCLVYL